ncbi:DUF411 domain-containing protein [Paracoccus sp. (in: a-proteobacteria)]|uniref:DUF411 domain-containing protein n=1 Tax=Paracoccus sp. TaxID=267 RepID=UPI003242DB84
MKKRIVAAMLTVLGAGGTFAFTKVAVAQDVPALTAVATVSDTAHQVTIWRDPGCGCCDTYAQYLEAHGYAVTLVDDPDFDRRSVDVGVPEQGLGCHLAQVDGYYVSGLVPVEIIERLVSERPNIDGITLPGMPGNAPGMAQVRSGTLKTYSFGEGGIAVYSNE